MQFSKAWDGKKGVKAHELKNPKVELTTMKEDKPKSATSGFSFDQKEGKK